MLTTASPAPTVPSRCVPIGSLGSLFLPAFFQSGGGGGVPPAPFGGAGGAPGAWLIDELEEERTGVLEDAPADVLTGKSVTMSPLMMTFAWRLKEEFAGSSKVTSPEMVLKS